MTKSQHAILLVLIVLVAVLPSFPGHVQSQTETILSVSPSQLSGNADFTVDASLTLAVGESLQGFEVRLFYNATVLNAKSTTLGTLFPPERAQPIVNCVDGGEGVYTLGCDLTDNPGVVHSAWVLAGDPVGGGAVGTIFSVTFSVTLVAGSSALDLSNSTLANPNGHPLIHRSANGIYSNSGLTAFFNVSPAILVVGRTVTFDATDSFNPTTSAPPITGYEWDFGDSTPLQSTGASTTHTFAQVGRYNVTLTVTDEQAAMAKITRSVQIVSALGGLEIQIIDTNGRIIQGNVTVKLFYGATLVRTEVKQFTAAGVAFYDIQAGSYTAEFSGAGIVTYSKEERVIEGWTTQDIVFLTLEQPVQWNYQDVALYVFLGVLGAGLVVGIVAIARRPEKGRSPRKTVAKRK